MSVVRLPARRGGRTGGRSASSCGCRARVGGPGSTSCTHSPTSRRRQGRFRRVVTLHDLQYRAVPELLTPARRLGTAVLLEAAARRADRVITVSQASGHEITEKLGIAPDRIDVIPNGVRLPDAAGRPSTGELRARFGLGDRPVVLAVGSDLPHKNLDRLLDAMALVPEARRPVLVLAGPGTDGPRLLEKAMAAGVSSDVHLAGFVAAADLDGLYALAELVVLPSLYEGLRPAGARGDGPRGSRRLFGHPATARGHGRRGAALCPRAHPGYGGRDRTGADPRGAPQAARPRPGPHERQHSPGGGPPSRR